MAPQWLWPQTTMRLTARFSTANSMAAAVPWKPWLWSCGGTKAPTLRTRNNSPGPAPVNR
jgi:hypothetical protein